MSMQTTMKKRIFLSACLAVLISTLFCGCKVAKVPAVTQSVPYQVAQNYFVRNDVKGLPPTVIRNEAKFEKNFGMATVMGPNGRPTEINFNKSFVICLSEAPTNINTDYSIISLSQTAAGQLAVRYAVKRGEKMSSTMQPLMLLIVDRKYDSLPVKLEPESTNR